MLSRAQQLRETALRCRALASSAKTEEGRSILFEFARRYEREASTAEETRDPVAAA